MGQIVRLNGGTMFRGDLEVTEDLLAAELLAGKCPAYAMDDDDEDYCDGARTCFNCRYRRWLADGFECARGLL